MGVVAVDLAHLGLSANEVQIVADAAVLAGAQGLAAREGESAAIADAIALARQNHVDGDMPQLTVSDVKLGNYNFETRQFVAGGAPTNAVRATSTEAVDNLLAGFFGEPQSTVERTAIAAHGGIAVGKPVMPIVVGECKFAQFQIAGSDCSSLPALTQAPNTDDNSGWTSLSTHSASASEAQKYLPSECGAAGMPSPDVRVGEMVNVLNGSATSILQVVKRCFDAGIREFEIPIVPCGPRGNYSQAMRVVGFATITVRNVRTTGGNKGIDLAAICRTERHPIGGGSFGTNSVALVH